MTTEQILYIAYKKEELRCFEAMATCRIKLIKLALNSALSECDHIDDLGVSVFTKHNICLYCGRTNDSFQNQSNLGSATQNRINEKGTCESNRSGIKDSGNTNVHLYTPRPGK